MTCSKKEVAQARRARYQVRAYDERGRLAMQLPHDGSREGRVSYEKAWQQAMLWRTDGLIVHIFPKLPPCLARRRVPGF